MFEAFYEGLMNLFQPIVFLAVLSGTIVAVILGILPGLQCGMGMVLLLPFILGKDPVIFFQSWLRLRLLVLWEAR